MRFDQALEDVRLRVSITFFSCSYTNYLGKKNPNISVSELLLVGKQPIASVHFWLSGWKVSACWRWCVGTALRVTGHCAPCLPRVAGGGRVAGHWSFVLWKLGFRVSAIFHQFKSGERNRKTEVK